MIKLDERLLCVSAFVRSGGVVADIGSDHGYLACYLVQNGISHSAYACDINHAPLAKTRQTIDEYGLSDKVIAKLSDGLSALKEVRLSDIIIAGMGGELIFSIVSEDILRDNNTRYILQPMTKAERLRVLLCENGFEIEKEAAATSGKFSYPVMCVKYTGNKFSPPALFAWTGKIWDNNDKASLEYLTHVKNTLEKMVPSRKDAQLADVLLKIKQRIG